MQHDRSAGHLVLVCLFATIAGCSGDDDSEHDTAPSAVTQPPIAGTAAASATCAVPACLASIFEQCQPKGACGSIAVEGGVEYCYENDVSIRSQPLPAASMIGSYSVNKADGTNCYIIGIYTAPEGLRYEYRSPLSLNLLEARASADGSWTIDCGSDSKYVLGSECSADMLLSPAGEFSRCDNTMPCAMTRGFGK